MSITQATASTSLQEGEGSSAPGLSASVPEQEGAAEAHRQQAADPRPRPEQPASRHSPATRGGQAAGQAALGCGPDTHLETLQPQPSG